MASDQDLLDATVLIVDDDDVFRERLGRALERRRFRVWLARSRDEALSHLRSHHIEKMILDLRIPGEWGLESLDLILAQAPSLRVVVLTAYGSIATAIEAVQKGAVGFLQKPATVEEILRAFEPSVGPDLRTETGHVLASNALPPARVPTLARAEWEHINRVLTECGGNIRRAAELLGVHRRTLQRKLAKFPVSR
ncbi:MAG: response regulator [Deltaproteobacteria bacterium]|nr:response regulator [Deltaproteobacteria bacterium]